MKNILTKFFFPTCRQAVVTHRAPEEIMRRLSEGIESGGKGRTQKPFTGRLEDTSFWFENRFAGNEGLICTRGKITRIGTGNQVEMVTGYEDSEWNIIWIAVMGVYLFNLYQGLSQNGPKVLWLFTGILVAAVIFIRVCGIMVIKGYSQKHLQFVRTALETEHGFDLSEYKRAKWKDVLALGAVAAACIIVVVLVTIKYILPLADGVR